MNNQGSLFPSKQMERLFSEYLRRYDEMQEAQQRENFWLVSTLLMVLIIIVIPVITEPVPIALLVLLIVITAGLFKQYQRSNERVNHVYINVHILYHHLTGKLEVGFCKHQEICHCADEFRNYVMEHYGISLEHESLQDHYDKSLHSLE